MTSMLSQDHEYYRSLSSHVSKLDAVQETVHKDQQHLSSLESDLENLKSTMSDMRAIREDYSPKMLNNNLERVDSRQLSSLFGPSSRGPGSRGPGSRGPMRSGSASGAEAALGAEAAPDGEDIEVKPTNRYPLRKRASAVSFAAKLVRSRKTKLLAAQKLEAELAAAARAAAEQKQRKRTMTLAEWKERRDRMREEAEAGSGAPSNLVSPAKPASPLKNAFPGVAPGVAPKFFPSPGKPTAALSRMRSATTLEIGSPPDPSRRPLEPLDGPATSFGDSVLDKPRFKPLSLHKLGGKGGKWGEGGKGGGQIRHKSHLVKSRSSPNHLDRESDSSGDDEAANDPVTQPDLVEVFRPLSASRAQFVVSSKK